MFAAQTGARSFGAYTGPVDGVIGENTIRVAKELARRRLAPPPAPHTAAPTTLSLRYMVQLYELERSRNAFRLLSAETKKTSEAFREFKAYMDAISKIKGKM